MAAADARTAVSFAFSPGPAGDSPAGRALLRNTPLSARHVLMDRAYEGDETRQMVLDLGMTPIVQSKRNRLSPREYDRQMYKKRNEVERLFFRFDKLDIVFTFFIYFALIIDALNSVNRP